MCMICPCTDEVQVGFDPQQFEVTEGVNGSVIVCVVLDGPLQRDGVVVDLFLIDDTAESKSLKICIKLIH